MPGESKKLASSEFPNSLCLVLESTPLHYREDHTPSQAFLLLINVSILLVPLATLYSKKLTTSEIGVLAPLLGILVYSAAPASTWLKFDICKFLPISQNLHIKSNRAQSPSKLLTVPKMVKSRSPKSWALCPLALLSSSLQLSSADEDYPLGISLGHMQLWIRPNILI